MDFKRIANTLAKHAKQMPRYAKIAQREMVRNAHRFESAAKLLQYGMEVSEAAAEGRIRVEIEGGKTTVHVVPKGGSERR